MSSTGHLFRVFSVCSLPVLLAPLPACTSQQVYGAGQTWQRNECNRIPDTAERSRCLKSAATSYEEYRQQKSAAGAE